MITKSRKKSPKKYCCKKCHYHSSNKFDFDKHLATTKHKMITDGNKRSQNVATLTCHCGKNINSKVACRVIRKSVHLSKKNQK